MKRHILALLLAWSAIQNPQTPSGTISGRVLNAKTSDPIPNTPVTLISTAGLSETALSGLLDQMSQLVTAGLQGQGGGGSQDITIRQVTNLLQSAGPNVRTQASVLTDRNGNFEFTNLPGGRYTVWVQRFNYFGPLLNGFPTSTASTTLAFDSPAGGNTGSGLVLYLTPGLAITGRALDAQGQPASGMAITAYRSTFTEGKPVWSPVLSRPIDDRGDYRLAPLAPGDYYVGVTPRLSLDSSATRQDPVRTFFPGVSEPSQATPLTLRDSDAARVDFTLRTAPATYFKVSGYAVNPSPYRSAPGIVDNGFSSFLLMPVESNLIDSASPNTFANLIAAGNRAAGEFEIRFVRPGVYELFPADLVSGLPSGRAIVDVRGADAIGVRLSGSAPVIMPGRIVVAGGNPQKSVSPDEVRVILKPWNVPPAFASRSITVRVHDGGQFALNGPAGASVMLQVSGLPDTAFVADIRMGATSVFDSGFGLSSSEQLQVVIDATNGATIDATIQTPAGRPAPRARVVLIPPEDQRQNPGRYKIGTADDDGHLTMRGVAPGSYLALAWESVPDSAWQNKEFLSRVQDQATTVQVSAGAQTKLQMKWIPFDTGPR